VWVGGCGWVGVGVGVGEGVGGWVGEVGVSEWVDESSLSPSPTHTHTHHPALYSVSNIP
jgi:hypothetical protein